MRVGRRGRALKSERPKSIEVKSLAVWSGAHSRSAGTPRNWPHTQNLGPALDLLDCRFSATKLYPTLCDPMDYSTSGFPVFHYVPEFVQIHVR